MWQGGLEIVEPHIYTTRRRGGQRFIVRQPSPYYTVARYRLLVSWSLCLGCALGETC